MQTQTIWNYMPTQPGCLGYKERKFTVFFAFIVMLASVTCRAGDDGVLEGIVDCSFMADHDGSEQKYVLIMPENFAKDQPVDALIALHGHGSDRWQFVRDSRDECRAARDVATANKMIFVSQQHSTSLSYAFDDDHGLGNLIV